jgi:hypothetical protein
MKVRKEYYEAFLLEPTKLNRLMSGQISQRSVKTPSLRVYRKRAVPRRAGMCAAFQGLFAALRPRGGSQSRKSR